VDAERDDDAGHAAIVTVKDELTSSARASLESAKDLAGLANDVIPSAREGSRCQTALDMEVPRQPAGGQWWEKDGVFIKPNIFG
jgi:hypothetical protein